MIASLNEFVKAADKRTNTCKVCSLLTPVMLKEIADSKGAVGAILIRRWLHSEGIEIGVSCIGRHLERCCD